MSSALTQVSYHQVASANRVRIIVNHENVTIDGDGGGKRKRFTRSYATPPELWKQVAQLAAAFEPGELVTLVEPSSVRDRRIRAVFRFRYGEEEEQTASFTEEEMPGKLRPLFDCLIDAWSPLDEVTYSENGMSEHLRLSIRRERTDLKSERGMPGKVDVSFATPADYWEELITAVGRIDVETLEEIEAPSNSRAADMALYAGVGIRQGGEWHRSQSFDDHKPPEVLRPLVELLRQAEKESFRRGR